MNRIRFALLAAAVIAPAPAAAADFPGGAPQPYLHAPSGIVAANWAGFYVGGNASYAWTSSDYFFSNGVVGERFPIGSSGFIGGGQLGAQAQWGHWVIGLEGTYGWAGLDETLKSSIAPLNTSELQIKEIGTLAGKLGWAADRLLIYGKAGLAYGHVRNRYVDAAALSQF